MEIGGNFCQILEFGGGLLLRDGEYCIFRGNVPPHNQLINQFAG